MSRTCPGARVLHLYPASSLYSASPKLVQSCLSRGSPSGSFRGSTARRAEPDRHRSPRASMLRRFTSDKAGPSAGGPSAPSSPPASAHKSRHAHDHDHDHGHDHDHTGLFHSHAHDHAEGAEQIMNALNSGKMDRGTRITLLG